MPTPSNTWYYVAGLAVIGWAFLAVFAGLRVGKVQQWWAWGLAVIGAFFTFAAGCYALDTFIASGAEFFLGFSWLNFLGFLYVMVSLVLLLAGLIPDKWMGIACGVNTAVFAFLLPSLLLGGSLPGEFGDQVKVTTREAQSTAMQFTAGWFG